MYYSSVETCSRFPMKEPEKMEAEPEAPLPPLPNNVAPRSMTSSMTSTKSVSVGVTAAPQPLAAPSPPPPVPMDTCMSPPPIINGDSNVSSVLVYMKFYLEL